MLITVTGLVNDYAMYLCTFHWFWLIVHHCFPPDYINRLRAGNTGFLLSTRDSRVHISLTFQVADLILLFLTKINTNIVVAINSCVVVVSYATHR